MAHSPLLDDYMQHLSQASAERPVLDLACGGGRNGLFLAQQGIPVVFADIREDALSQVADQSHIDSHRLWQVDLEQGEENPLGGRQFFAILVFRYLHRPLLPAIREAVCPGGLTRGSGTQQAIAQIVARKPDSLDIKGEEHGP